MDSSYWKRRKNDTSGSGNDMAYFLYLSAKFHILSMPLFAWTGDGEFVQEFFVSAKTLF